MPCPDEQHEPLGRLHPGDRLRSKRRLRGPSLRDADVLEEFPAGCLWTVVPGSPAELPVLRLHQPNGVSCTHESVGSGDFEIHTRAPRIGQRARLIALPDWVPQLPPISQKLFSLCLGSPLPVADVDRDGLLVLDASVFDSQVGDLYNDIRVEAEFVEAEEKRLDRTRKRRSKSARTSGSASQPFTEPGSRRA